MVNWVGWARGKWKKKKKILLTNWNHQVALSILYGLWVPSQGLLRDKSCSKPRGTQKIAEIVGSSSNSHRPEGKAGLELLSILLKATALAQSQDWLTYPSSDVFELYHIIPLLRAQWTQCSIFSWPSEECASVRVSIVRLASALRYLWELAGLSPTRRRPGRCSFFHSSCGWGTEHRFWSSRRVHYVTLGKLFSPPWTSVCGLSGFREARAAGRRCPVIGNCSYNCIFCSCQGAICYSNLLLYIYALS